MTAGQQQGSGPADGLELCLDDAAYVLGSLSPAERQTFERHLSGCSRCQASVGRLAGLPGLLAVTSAVDVGAPAVPPDNLLPKLLEAVARQRRRRMLLSGLAGAAVAATVALVIALVTWPAPIASQALPAPLQMQPLVNAPLDVSLQLVDKQWGTSVVVHCAYDGPIKPGAGYQLVAFDPTGKPQTLGWWASVAGSASTVNASSSWHLKDITRFEVQLSDGHVILRAEPPR